ncbi:MAG: ribosome maturation factor RimM, partial [Paracoccaceae bacterium]
MMKKDLICVGAIAGAFGVNGEVRLKSFCADPAAIADYAPLTTATADQEFSVEIIRTVKNGFAARLSGVVTKEQADELRGTELFAARSMLPNLPDEEYYHADLIGLRVSDTGGASLGTVKSVQNHGAGDLLEVQLPNSSATV